MSTRNPLIHEHNPDETLHNANAVLEYLQCIEEIDIPGDDARFGYYRILACVSGALEYEKHRVETLRKAAKADA